MGLQASGKSSFYLQQFYDTHIRLNLDMLKTRHREQLLFRACLTAKQPLVIDNTNPTLEDRQRYIPALQQQQFAIIGYYFSANLQQSLARNQQRCGKACVPEAAIRATYAKLQRPSYQEGFTQLYYVQLNQGQFTRLTKETHDFTAPFDVRVRDMMLETVKHLMQCGFKVLYGYTQSDEISLLFYLNENSFQRKERKLTSVLAGEASAKFSVLLGDVGAFDCRISQLPAQNLVLDYFRWRQADAHRNALNAHCYWHARQQGLSATAATAQFAKLSISAKNEYLFQHGINFNELPAWQKRGSGVYWQTLEKIGFNPKTGENVKTQRRELWVNTELPVKELYANWLAQSFLN